MREQIVHCDPAMQEAFGISKLHLRELPKLMAKHRRDLTKDQFRDWTSTVEGNPFNMSPAEGEDDDGEESGAGSAAFPGIGS